jgi:hypothetical protein
MPAGRPARETAPRLRARADPTRGRLHASDVRFHRAGESFPTTTRQLQCPTRSRVPLHVRWDGTARLLTAASARERTRTVSALGSLDHPRVVGMVASQSFRPAGTPTFHRRWSSRVRVRRRDAPRRGRACRRNDRSTRGGARWPRRRAAARHGRGRSSRPPVRSRLGRPTACMLATGIGRAPPVRRPAPPVRSGGAPLAGGRGRR